MPESRTPLRLEYRPGPAGLTIAYQAAPPGSASVSATYVAPAGWGFDPPARRGLARVVNAVGASAAGPYDRVELARRLDALGAAVSRQAAPESAELTIGGPADRWRTLLEILGHLVLRPRFDRDDLARVRRQVFERQSREMTQPASRADKELLAELFPGGHPYGATGLGVRAGVARLTRDDLVRFHGQHYTADGALLVLTAPLRPSVLVGFADHVFRGLPGHSAPTLGAPAARTGGAAVRMVPLPGSAQVEVRVGGRSIARTSELYPAAFLADEVLGGRPLLARLFQRVRERGGLAYHASSELEAMRYGGYWIAQAGTGPERWRKVVPMLHDELDRLRSEEVPERELRTTRESSIGAIPLGLETTAEAHELALEAAYHRLPEEYWVTWPDRLRTVSRREVREAAAVAFDRASQRTVLAGPGLDD